MVSVTFIAFISSIVIPDIGLRAVAIERAVHACATANVADCLPQQPARRRRAQPPCLTWSTVSGRVFWHGPPALSKLQLAPIFANIVDSEGRETGKGSYLRIRNYSSTDTVFITSMATGDHRMLVGPEETYRPYISTYKTPGQQTTADLEVTYCSRRY